MKLLCILFVYSLVAAACLVILDRKRTWFDNIIIRINNLAVWKISIILLIAVFFLDGIHILYKYTPFVADEVYTLSGGAFFAGYDWSSYMSLHKFYNFGYTMLLAPLYRIIDDPIVLYRSLLAVNVLLECFSIIIVYRILRLQLGFSNVKSIVIALAVCCSTFVLQFHTYVYNEMPLTFLVWVTLALMLRLVDTKREERIILSLLLGFCMGYMYIIHSRCVVFYIAAAIVWIMYLIVYKKWIANPIATVITFLGTILGGSKLIDYVQVNLYLKDLSQSMDNSVGSAVSLGVSRYAILKSFEGIIRVIKHFITLAGTLNVSTGGLLLILTIVSIYCAVKYRKQYVTDKYGKQYFIITILSYVSLWGMVSCVAVLGAGNQLVRWMAYSRYYAAFLGPFLLIGILMLLKNHGLKNRTLWIWTMIGNVVVILLYAFYAYPVMKGASMKENASLYIFRCFSVHNKQTKFSWSVFGIAVLIMFVGSLIFLFLYQKKRVLVMCALLLGFSAILFQEIDCRQNREASRRRYEMSNASYELMESSLLPEDVKVYYGGTGLFGKAILVTLYNKDVTYLKGVKNLPDLENAVLLTNNPEKYSVGTECHIFQLDSNEYI
ncbi:MAG: hypothetical protein K2I10_11390, partial [Lachnospiraceae bacterium]|nr:hypothetical protein [Lachnospiraceae bacterium]